MVAHVESPSFASRSRPAADRGRRPPARRRHAQGDRAARLPRRSPAAPLGATSLAGLLWPETDPDRARARRSAHALDATHGARRSLARRSDRETRRSRRDGIWLDVAELRGARRRARPTACGRRDVPPLPRAARGRPPRSTAAVPRRLRAPRQRRVRRLAAARPATSCAASSPSVARPAGGRARSPGDHAAGDRGRAAPARARPAPRARAPAADPPAAPRPATARAALEQYRDCVRVLDRELGVRPLDETTALYHAILEGSLTRRAARGWSGEPTAARGALRARRAATASSRRSSMPTTASDPTAGSLALVGEAGIGKTRLCRRVARRSSRERGATALAVRCFQEEAGSRTAS